MEMESENQRLARELACSNTVGRECRDGCRWKKECSEEEKRKFYVENRVDQPIDDPDFFKYCDIDGMAEAIAERLKAQSWHFMIDEVPELPENGQWCAVIINSVITKYPSGRIARWYDGNIATAWHDWFREIMPEACWYEPVVNGGISKISSRGLDAVIAWMPIEMAEGIYDDE